MWIKGAAVGRAVQLSALLTTRREPVSAVSGNQVVSVVGSIRPGDGRTVWLIAAEQPIQPDELEHLRRFHDDLKITFDGMPRDPWANVIRTGTTPEGRPHLHRSR